MTKAWTNRPGLALRHPLVLVLGALAIGLGNGCSSTSLVNGGGGGHAGNGTGAGGAGGQEDPWIDAGVFPCGMTVAQKCASIAPETCDLTWSAVQTDTSLCTANTTTARHLEHDCVGYHVLGTYGIDSGTEFYYDSTTGDLVAILNVGVGSNACVGGPADGFTHPLGCSNSYLPPPDCAVDGGNG
jgi:hypothetical protein